MSATTAIMPDLDDCIDKLDEAHVLARALRRAIGDGPEGLDARALLTMFSRKLVEARDGLLELPVRDAPSGPAWTSPAGAAP